METKYKYNPSDYVDYLCESMTDFYAALPTGNAIRLSGIWERIFFDTKQAVKESDISPAERDEILAYYDGLVPNA